jgi:hypothetical protein
MIAKCKHCGRSFRVKLADLKRGRGQFCTRQCYDHARAAFMRSYRCEPVTPISQGSPA